MTAMDALHSSGTLVLNVDDNEAARYAKNHLVRTAGYRVLEAATGAEALRLARDAGPQLALIDVKLPDIPGVEICRTIKADPAIASMMVLLISAACIHPDDKVTGLEGGADGYLIDPVGGEELLATVKALLRIYHSEQRLELALKATRDVVWDKNLGHDHESSGSPAARVLFGWTKHSPIFHAGGWTIERLHPDDRQRVTEGLRVVLDDPHASHWQDEYRVLAAGDEYAWVMDRGHIIRNSEGTPVRMVGAMQDITARRRTEEELRQSHDNLRAHAEELALFNRAAVDRELRMIELKSQINDLCAELGRPALYPISRMQDADASPECAS